MKEVIDNMYFIESVIIKTENEDVNTLSLYWVPESYNWLHNERYFYIYRLVCFSDLNFYFPSQCISYQLTLY